MALPGRRWRKAAFDSRRREHRAAGTDDEPGINTPPTSSLGRFFDGVAAILGGRRKVTFEGQAAMELEGMAREGAQKLLPFTISEGRDVASRSVSRCSRASRRQDERRPAGGAGLFFSSDTDQRPLRTWLWRSAGENRTEPCGLSGGCFQNRILLEGSIRELKDAGFRSFSPSPRPDK